MATYDNVDHAIAYSLARDILLTPSEIAARAEAATETYGFWPA